MRHYFLEKKCLHGGLWVVERSVFHLHLVFSLSVILFLMSILAGAGKVLLSC